MSLQDGFYRVLFGTPIGEGAGVAYFADGKVHGGDSMMAYVGTYEVSGDDVSATVNVLTHTPQAGMASVLGAGTATLSLSGTANGGTAELSGTAPEAPGVVLTLRLDPIA